MLQIRWACGKYFRRYSRCFSIFPIFWIRCKSIYAQFRTVFTCPWKTACLTVLPPRGQNHHHVFRLLTFVKMARSTTSYEACWQACRDIIPTLSKASISTQLHPSLNNQQLIPNSLFATDLGLWRSIGIPTPTTGRTGRILACSLCLPQFLPFLVLCFRHVRTVPKRSEYQRRRYAYCNCCSPGKNPSQALDFASCVRVQGDSDLIIKLLNL